MHSEIYGDVKQRRLSADRVSDVTGRLTGTSPEPSF